MVSSSDLSFFGFYAALSGTSVPTFRDSLSVQYLFLGFLALEDGTDRCTETSVHNYHSTPYNIIEEGWYHLHGGMSLKSRVVPSWWPRKKVGAVPISAPRPSSSQPIILLQWLFWFLSVLIVHACIKNNVFDLYSTILFFCIYTIS
jgi:hypothetical protein